MDDMSKRDGIAGCLLNAGAVLTYADNGGELFTLASGDQSPIYVNLRGPVLKDTVLRVVSEALIARLPEGTVLLASPPYAGIPLMAGVLVRSCIDPYVENGASLRGLYWRKEKKTHGTAVAIEGVFERGDEVVVIDDVITDGATKIAALEPLTDAGLVVKHVVVLVDREQGGAETLAEHGIMLHSALSLRDIVRNAAERGVWDPGVVTTVTAYLDAHAA